MAEATHPEVQHDPKMASWTLSEPVRRGETLITDIMLRKPGAPELRGLTLQDVISTDFSTLYLLIPRISMPPLTQDEANALDPVDLAEAGGIIRGFFMTRAEKQAIEAFIAERVPKS